MRRLRSRAFLLAIALACCAHGARTGTDASAVCRRTCDDQLAGNTACGRDTIPEGVANNHPIRYRAGGCDGMSDPRDSACLSTYNDCLESCDERAKAPPP